VAEHREGKGSEAAAEQRTETSYLSLLLVCPEDTNQRRD
jgi:hypothetical protein